MALRILQLVAVLACCVASGQAAAQQYVVVVLDDSGSMSERLGSSPGIKMAAAKAGLLSVLSNLPADAEVGVLALNTTGVHDGWIVPLGPVDRQQYEPQIKRLAPGGGTPLGAAMKIAADQLLTKRKQSIYGTYRLLIVTDGEANDRALMERYLPDIKSRGILLDVIGVGMQSQHSLATKVNTYRRADDANSLKQALSEVFAETTGDAGDAAAEDFELISGLPDEMAMQALQAFAQNTNEPISTERADLADNRPKTTANGNVPRQPAGRTPANSGSGLGGFCCCFLFLLIGGAVIVKLVSSILMKK